MHLFYDKQNLHDQYKLQFGLTTSQFKKRVSSSLLKTKSKLLSYKRNYIFHLMYQIIFIFITFKPTFFF